MAVVEGRRRCLGRVAHVMTRSPWAREYARTPDEYIWGTQPSEFARATRPLLSRGSRVLDIGCGEGRDSVFFATCGCEVTSLDVSAAGLRKAERLARAHGGKIRWGPGDAARDIPSGPFEPAYSCGALPYLPPGPRGPPLRPPLA